MNYAFRYLVLFPLLLFLFGDALAQTRGSRTIFGDLKIDESTANAAVPVIFDVVLYSEGRMQLDHQWVSPNGRYRFNVPSGIYDIAVELDGKEVARIRVEMLSPLVSTYRRDIELEFRARPGSETRVRAGLVSAADLYKRGPATAKLFSKAEEAVNQKEYDQAVSLFQQILKLDEGDYQSWTELATVYLMQKNSAEAEKGYLRAIEIQPTYLLALIDLGRLRLSLKNFDGAIDLLTRAVAVKHDSAEANYFLGEAYLQIRKGSKAVGYLNEALRLEPMGMAEAHLRLALLYHGAGMKDKAAIEYEQFLKKRPEYPDRKKLEQYIAANKKL